MAKKLKLQPKPRSKEKIEQVLLENEAKDNFINYSIATASDRAIPDVLTGLKPVHTRLVFGTKQLGLTSDKKPSKSQRITGDVMGKYHPHGESYPALVTLSRPFEHWFPPIEVHGNNDDIIGNKAAAPRYTEARLSPYGDLMTHELSKELVPYEPNYDNTLEMPIVLPVPYPALLINGTKYGIAVGYATNIAPHNPIEALNLMKEYYQNPTMSLDDMLKIMPGPDFPTGGVLIGDPKPYYETGKANFQNKGVIKVTGKNTLVITEIPYMMGHAVIKYVENVLTKIADQKLKGIKKIEDYTDGENNETNIEITFDPKVLTPEQAIAMLERHTDIKQTYNPSWLALDDLTPHVFTLREYLENFTTFQHQLTINRFIIVKRKAERRLEIVQGLLTLQEADRLETIIQMAKASKSKDDFIKQLIESFGYTKRQAEEIATTPIHKLNTVNFKQLIKEEKTLTKTIKDADKIITNKKVRVAYLVKVTEKLLEDLVSNPYYKRRTKLVKSEKTQVILEDILVEDITVTINEFGYIKMYDQLKTQEDTSLTYLNGKDNDILCAFGKSGIMYQLPLKKLSKFSARDKSRGELGNVLFGLPDGEQVLFYCLKTHLEQEKVQMVMISERGLAKRFATKGTSLITTTVRKQTKAYKSKYDNDDLIFVALLTDEEINTATILAVREDTVKHIKCESLKLQGSASGSGAQTFTNKKQDKLDNVHIIPKDVNINIENVEYGNFESSKQELIKENQTFKPINR